MSHARKHVISAMVNDYVEPDPAKHEFIVRVVEERGSNQYLVEKPVRALVFKRMRVTNLL